MGIRDIERPSMFGLSLRNHVSFYWFVLAITALLTFVLWWIVRSPWGRAFTALRENPLRAESLGVDVRLYTLLAFALGSAHGGMGYLLISAGQVMETEKVFASLVVLAVAGAVVIKLQQWIDRLVAPWAAHADER